MARAVGGEGVGAEDGGEFAFGLASDGGDLGLALFRCGVACGLQRGELGAELRLDDEHVETGADRGRLRSRTLDSRL